MIPRFLLLYILSVGLAWAGDARPEIEALLGYVENLNGATFIRNGDEHRAKEAAAHLKTKWGRLEKNIATAEDFIRLCASKSSLSGERYKVRFSDGSERFCDELLRDKLKQLRAEAERRKESTGSFEGSEPRPGSPGEIRWHVVRRRIRAGLFHQDAFAQWRPLSGAIIYPEISQPHDDMQAASCVIIVLSGRLGLDTERPAIFAEENETHVSFGRGRGRLLSTHDYWLWTAPDGRPADPLSYEGVGTLSKQHPEKLQGFLTAVRVNCCPGPC
jgi:hypothetical protein